MKTVALEISLRCCLSIHWQSLCLCCLLAYGILFVVCLTAIWGWGSKYKLVWAYQFLWISADSVPHPHASPPMQPHPQSLVTSAHQSPSLHSRNTVLQKKTKAKLVSLQNYRETFLQILKHKSQNGNNSVFPIHKIANQIMILLICAYFIQYC